MMELMPVVWLHARMTHARMKGITYLRRSRDSLILPPVELLARSVALVSSISRSSDCAWSLERERSNALNADSFFPLRKSQRGDSPTKKLPITKRIPGGSDTQKMPRHAVFLNANNREASPSCATLSTR